MSRNRYELENYTGGNSDRHDRRGSAARELARDEYGQFLPRRSRNDDYEGSNRRSQNDYEEGSRYRRSGGGSNYYESRRSRDYDDYDGRRSQGDHRSQGRSQDYEDYDSRRSEDYRDGRSAAASRRARDEYGHFLGANARRVGDYDDYHDEYGHRIGGRGRSYQGNSGRPSGRRTRPYLDQGDYGTRGRGHRQEESDYYEE